MFDGSGCKAMATVKAGCWRGAMYLWLNDLGDQRAMRPKSCLSYKRP